MIFLPKNFDLQKKQSFAKPNDFFSEKTYIDMEQTIRKKFKC
jgi:hypothetical protein